MRRHPQRSRTNQDRWLISYADFITLMFGFFVVMFAFAKADHPKQAAIVASINTAFHHSNAPQSGDLHASPPQLAPAPSIDSPRGVRNEDVPSLARVRDDFAQARRDLDENLSSQIASHAVSIYMGRDGLVISMREAGFFASGSATPGAQTLPIRHQVAKAPFDLRIEGHTDNVPMHNATFDSNWELSTARATGIARMILNLSPVSPERISAAGYAGFHPIASNDTEEGRSENRRVDLVLVPSSRIDFLDAQHPERSTWRRVTDN
jgi:chemotaxis protein MotB